MIFHYYVNPYQPDFTEFALSQFCNILWKGFVVFAVERLIKLCTGKINLVFGIERGVTKIPDLTSNCHQ